MSVEKHFRRCVDPCQRCLTLDDTHDLCVMCLGEEHARSVLEGMECIHCEPFFCGKKLRSRLSLFLERIGAIIRSGPAAAEAVKRLSSWRSQMKLANEFEKEEFFISRLTAADESELREEYVLSVTSSDPAGSALLAHGVCDVELLEAMKRALLLGKPTVEARKRGSGSQ